MNAYELADLITVKPSIPIDVEHLNLASKMLRQQAKHIEELENNILIQNTHIEMLEYDIKSLAKRYKALSHPHKELSDDEIYKIIFKAGFDEELFLNNIANGDTPLSLVLARAIIKASRGEE